MSCVALCRHNSGKSLYRNVSKCAGLHHRRMYSQADASNVMCSALQSSGIALSDIQKTILTNREYFYLRVPSYTALVMWLACASFTSALRGADVAHGHLEELFHHRALRWACCESHMRREFTLLFFSILATPILKFHGLADHAVREVVEDGSALHSVSLSHWTQATAQKRRNTAPQYLAKKSNY